MFIGVDTHRDFHVAVVSAMHGALLGEMHLPAYGWPEALLDWALELSEGQATSLLFRIEGTGCYGAGLSRLSRLPNAAWREPPESADPSPARQGRRDRRRSAADRYWLVQRQPWPRPAMLMQRFSGFSKSTRDSAVRCRTRAITQLKALLIVVPAELRETLQHLNTIELVNRCLDRNEEVATNPVTAAWMAMRFLAERIRYLEQELMVLGRQLDRITQAIAPDLRAAQGIGPDNAATLLIAAGDNPQRLRSEDTFAALCGCVSDSCQFRNSSAPPTEPWWEPSGQLCTVPYCSESAALGSATKAYAERRTAEGKSKRESLRCLKRFIAREVYRLLQAGSLCQAAMGT